MRKKIFKIGFIGSGATAKKHADVIKKFKDYKISSVFSKNIKNAIKFAKQYNIDSAFDNFKEFKNALKYDLIIVCLPPDKVLEYIKKTISLDANIFIEKPLGLNFIEANKILNLYKNKKNKKNLFFVGYNRRFLGSVIKLKKIISNQSSKRFVDIQDQQDLIKAKFLGHKKAVLKNWMYANSIHTIDFFNFLLRGKIIKIESRILKFQKSHVIFSLMKTSYGDIGRYICYWNLMASWKVSVLNKHNELNLNPLEHLQIKKKNNVQNLKNFNLEDKFKPGFYYQFIEIDKALKNKKNYAVTIFDAIKSVQIVKKIYE